MSTNVSLGLLLIRLPMGAIFVLHGWKKVMGDAGFKDFADYLEHLGVPAPLASAFLAVGAEVGGGAVLILGLGALSRIAGLLLAFTMGVAIYAHWGNGFLNPLEVSEAGAIRFGYEYNVALLGMALCIIFTGPGRFGLWCGGRSGGGGSSGAAD